MDVQALEPRIREILTAPGVDLGTISAKRVRKQLLEQDPNLTVEQLKENKDEVDALIGRIYEEVSGPREQGGADDEEEGSSNGKRKQEEEEGAADEDDDGNDETDEETSRPKKKTKMSKEERDDAELARQLSNELNGRSRSSRTGKASGPKKPRKSKKSAATVDSDDSEGGTKKKRGGGGAKGGFAKEYALSEPLAAVVDAEKMSRPQLVKQLWVYIKANDLQNPQNKKEIMCDDKLRAVFNTDKIDMFKMNKAIGQHLHEP
ncbi:SWIB-domain-containing protein [Gloeophyllum trabeum ATCC 11539]|uniref:SWIB-domain-containing protein n=1 Tax=Gloeophyllum trabeum (strain ATCC 11539 / FP-39264 / Madison 617) TaxID=670483 RepID=S7Q4X4_GLOTA|nr:SWIB-domain-containing protein [Gloeophyllum trabeum ATCC 11539]EPQ55071.1 SWIB-domain-containing protein [Gloeophyllum trabeum ATCC 11539]